MNFELLNVKLLSHPVNWGIVWVTLIIAGFGYSLLHDAIMGNAANNSIAPD